MAQRRLLLVIYSLLLGVPAAVLAAYGVYLIVTEASDPEGARLVVGLGALLVAAIIGLPALIFGTRARRAKV
jgi:hypothetical protein